MTTLPIDLPSINGEFEAGLVVGTDPTLPQTDKMPVLVTSTTYDAVKYAAIWAYDRWFHKADPARSLYVCGAAVAVSAGLCVKVGTRLDGDWVEVVANPASITSFTHSEALNKILTVDNYRKALSVIVACKANWWLSNHHTGPDEVQGYARKVLSLLFTKNIDRNLTDAARTVSKWCSTIKVLRIAGIEGLVGVSDPVPTAITTLTLSTEAKLRFGNFPAGTQSCVIAYEAAKRLIRSPLIKFCPGAVEFARIPEARRQIIANPASYHIEASYLTGRPRADYADTENEVYLGRLGIYIRVLFPKSTLAKSPHMSESKVDSCKDNSPEWFSILSQYRKMTRTSTQQALQELAVTSGSTSPEAIEELRRSFQHSDA